MSARQPTGLAARLIAGQIVVVVVGSLTLAATAAFVAPALFRRHLTAAGVTSDPVTRHAEQAFALSLLVALTTACVAALVAAGIASWLAVRTVTAPLQQLARAADAIAEGRFDMGAPLPVQPRELQSLLTAFARMTSQLADTDASRSRLLSDLSHELRTPLATLSAYIDGMQDGVVPVDAQSWETMRTQVGRLSRLTTDVRDVAAAQEGSLDARLQRTDPVALAHGAVAAAGPRYAARGVELACRGPATVAGVLGDAERLAQVLAILLDNALRHTPAGGHVTLDVSGREDQVQLDVTDDGDGIPADQLETIFQRFYRVDPSRVTTDDTGSGLGLTIARAIVTTHHGTLVANSAGRGRGTTVTLRLPRALRS